MDSTKLLTEKLALARELSALRPELDQLRSQASSHQSLLAEKLSLQRQLSTVQVELATEKRATERALSKEGRLRADDAKFQSRMESLQTDLTKERRERQKTEREAQNDSIESGNRIATLESRLDAFRDKMKITKEQLREAQMSLQTAQSYNHGKPGRVSAMVSSTTSLMGNPRKRAATHMDADTILGTPGDFTAAKNSKWGSTIIGEKSTFSITPFLNRTTSTAPVSPPQENASGDDQRHIKQLDYISGNTVQKVMSSTALSDLVDMSYTLTNAVKANKAGTLQTAKAGRTNSQAPPTRKTKAALSLEQVAEENLENEPSATDVSESAVIKNSCDEIFGGSLELKKRKRRLLKGGLGKTLFDEDEADAPKGDQGSLVGVRGFGALRTGGFGVREFGPRKAIGPTMDMGTFGAISPLKKDRIVPNGE